MAAREDYVRPPIVAHDAPHRQIRKWRFPAVIVLLLAAVLVAVVLIAWAFIHDGNGNAQGAPHRTLPVRPTNATAWRPQA
jgi:hypothetical protein